MTTPTLPQQSYEYDAIRPYLDHEVPSVVAQLAQHPDLKRLLEQFIPAHQIEGLLSTLASCRSVDQFTTEVSYPVVHQIAAQTTFTVSLSGAGRLGGNLPTTFVTNHRDIILDSAFLCMAMHERNYLIPRIAIGDNLFGLPWIEPVVKLNGSFVVRRSLPLRQMLPAAQTLSAFIDQSINQDHKSVWIAQREGRAKDNSDQTQASILKMIASKDSAHPLDQLRRVNIAPTTLSYEFDPCDILKAHELLIRQEHPEEKYIKAPEEDLINMKTGLTGYKGRVHIAIGTRLNDLLSESVTEELRAMSKQQLYGSLAEIIDREIHRNYRLYPINYIAFDRLYPDQAHPEGLYSRADENTADIYLSEQISKAPSGRFSEAELRTQLYKMYAQPLINNRKVNASL